VLTSNDPPDDPTHSLPGNAHQAGHGGAVASLGEVGGVSLEGEGEPRGALGPGDMLDLDPAVPTLDAAQRVAQVQRDTSEVEVSPATRTAVVYRGDAVAVGASRSTPSGPDIDEQALGAELEAGDERGLESEEGAE